MAGEEWQKDHKHNIDFYTDRLDKHGVDAKSLNWGSKESQFRRFEILAQIADLNGTSLLDVGCGLGDFYEWLSDKKIDADYQGVDITPAMIETAKARFDGVSFHCDDLLEDDCLSGERFDYVVSSGIFYLRENDPFAFMKDMITKMYSLCNKGLAFNSLSSWMESEEKEFRADPAAVLEFCRTLTPYVVLRHDYHPGDFTINMYRDKVEI